MQPPARSQVSSKVLVLVLVLIGTIIILLSANLNDFSAYLQNKKPSLVFPNNHLKVQRVTDMLSSPTSMAFVDNNSMLVLERSGKGRVCVSQRLSKTTTSLRGTKQSPDKQGGDAKLRDCFVPRNDVMVRESKI